jgi:hypothetical protein
MTFRIIAAALLLALPAAGADQVLPKLRIEPTAGGSIFYVKNVSSQPLTSFVVELVDYPGSFYALFEDEILHETIAPDAAKRIPVSNMTVGAVPDYVKIQAAIYADGSAAGVPERVAQLVARRHFLLSAVQDVIQRLDVLKDANASKESAAASLRSARDFTMLPAGAGKMSQLSINLAASRVLFSDAADYVEKHTLTESLSKMREWEKTLMDSKPPMQ